MEVERRRAHVQRGGEPAHAQPLKPFGVDEREGRRADPRLVQLGGRRASHRLSLFSLLVTWVTIELNLTLFD